MEKLKFSLFDFFSYFTPALIFILGIYLLQEKIEIISINNIINKFSLLQSESNLLFIPIIYVVGFVMSVPSNYFYKSIEKILSLCIYTKNQKVKTKIRNSDMYILIREFSPNNFTYIEIWNIYKKLSINLLFNLFCYYFIKILIYNSFDWESFIFMLLISFTLIITIRQFDKWRIIECINTIEILKLNENSEEKFNSKWQK